MKNTKIVMVILGAVFAGMFGVNAIDLDDLKSNVIGHYCEQTGIKNENFIPCAYVALAIAEFSKGHQDVKEKYPYYRKEVEKIAKIVEFDEISEFLELVNTLDLLHKNLKKEFDSCNWSNAAKVAEDIDALEQQSKKLGYGEYFTDYSENEIQASIDKYRENLTQKVADAKTQLLNIVEE